MLSRKIEGQNIIDRSMPQTHDRIIEVEAGKVSSIRQDEYHLWLCLSTKQREVNKTRKGCSLSRSLSCSLSRRFRLKNQEIMTFSAFAAKRTTFP